MHVPWHHFPNKRPGAVHVEHNGSATTLVGTPQGLPPHVFTLLAGQVGSSASDTSLAAGIGGGFWLTFVLPKQGNANSIVLSSSPAATSAETARGIILEQRAQELARYPRWGHLAEAKEQIQTVLGWNAIYVPYERGVVIPVTRRCDKGYGYALFNWDSMFAAWMMGLDKDEEEENGNKSSARSSLNIGLSHFVQTVQGRTERGFFASFRTGMIQTRDKSQPPVASRVALELYKRYGRHYPTGNLANLRKPQEGSTPPCHGVLRRPNRGFRVLILSKQVRATSRVCGRELDLQNLPPLLTCAQLRVHKFKHRRHQARRHCKMDARAVVAAPCKQQRLLLGHAA